jgi:hypothetical protein
VLRKAYGTRREEEAGGRKKQEDGENFILGIFMISIS